MTNWLTLTKNRFKNRLRPSDLSLPGAILFIIFAACCVVAVAFYMYWNDPNRKYDLARPGAQDNRSVHVEDESADTTSPATASVVKQKIDFLEKELDALKEISRFNPNDLNDRAIQLEPADQPSL